MVFIGQWFKRKWADWWVWVDRWGQAFFAALVVMRLSLQMRSLWSFLAPLLAVSLFQIGWFESILPAAFFSAKFFVACVVGVGIYGGYSKYRERAQQFLLHRRVHEHVGQLARLEKEVQQISYLEEKLKRTQEMVDALQKEIRKRSALERSLDISSIEGNPGMSKSSVPQTEEISKSRWSGIGGFFKGMLGQSTPVAEALEEASSQEEEETVLSQKIPLAQGSSLSTLLEEKVVSLTKERDQLREAFLDLAHTVCLLCSSHQDLLCYQKAEQRRRERSTMLSLDNQKGDLPRQRARSSSH